MFSRKFYTLLTLFFLGYFFINFFLKDKLLINYDSIELNTNIQLFMQNDIRVMHDQLNNLPFYSSVAKALTGDLLAEEILFKIQRNEICNRLDLPKRRNPKIIPSKNSVELSLIFQDSNNAINCEDDIKKYIIEKKKFYIDNVDIILKHFDSKAQNLNILYYSQDTNMDEKKNYEYFSSYLVNFYEDYKFYKKNLNQISASDFIYFNSEINSNSDFNIKIINHLYLLFVIILSLIMYRKKLEIFFNKIKNKL